MSESGGIDSILRGRSMPRPYSNDLRSRVIEAIEAGASRRGGRPIRAQPERGGDLGPALGRNWERCGERNELAP